MNAGRLSAGERSRAFAGTLGKERPGRKRPALLAGSALRRASGGWTLIELVVTVTVLAILTLGVVPLVQNSVRRYREQRLREALREMREAIKEFHRDTVGMQCTGLSTALPGAGAPGGVTNPPGAAPGAPQQSLPPDPRQRVVVSDCTIFGVDNPDRYPPTLETLVEGVNVVPVAALGGALGGVSGRQATDNQLVSTKKKHYLRAIPTDPVTGKQEWALRSLYDAPDSSEWGGENVFDVRSRSNATALDGSKYSEW